MVSDWIILVPGSVQEPVPTRLETKALGHLIVGG